MHRRKAFRNFEQRSIFLKQTRVDLFAESIGEQFRVIGREVIDTLVAYDAEHERVTGSTGAVYSVSDVLLISHKKTK